MTSEEVARLANVSRSTVSRVINNYSNVPEETRRKVMKVIEEYNYVPNSSARNLAGKSNNIITLFIYDEKHIDNYNNRWKGSNSPFYMDMIAELINAAKEYQYIVSAYIVTSQEEYAFIESMFDFRFISGGIFAEFETQKKQLNRLIKKGFRMMVIDPPKGLDKSNQVEFIHFADEEGGYQATRHLIENGHRVIGHITGDERISSIRREEGYRRAMKEAGISVQEKWVESGRYVNRDAYEATKRLVQQNPQMTAIFVANDIMAASAIQALWEMKLRVPEDISVIGFDNLEPMIHMGLRLTSMEVSKKQFAQDVMIRLCKEPQGKQIICPAILVKGDTVKKI